jgi:hypothetical protein
MTLSFDEICSTFERFTEAHNHIRSGEHDLRHQIHVD